MISTCFDEYVLHAEPDRVPMLRDLLNDGTDWFHSFRFSGGLVGPGRDPSAKKLHHLCLPGRLDGLSVLDVGAYEGFFSFHLEQRGAAKVVAADEFVWTWPDSPKPHFDGIRRGLGSNVREVVTSVENLSTNVKEKFDIVLFLGVLYHAPNMMEYLKQIVSVTKTVCVIETFLDLLDLPAPAAQFYPSGSLNNDGSNWWGPNAAAVVEMCRRAGFPNVDLINFWDINTRAQLEGAGKWGPMKTGRAVFYAYR